MSSQFLICLDAEEFSNFRWLNIHLIDTSVWDIVVALQKFGEHDMHHDLCHKIFLTCMTCMFSELLSIPSFMHVILCHNVYHVFGTLQYTMGHGLQSHNWKLCGLNGGVDEYTMVHASLGLHD